MAKKKTTKSTAKAKKTVKIDKNKAKELARKELALLKKKFVAAEKRAKGYVQKALTILIVCSTVAIVSIVLVIVID